MNDLFANIGAGVALMRADDGEIVYTNDRWDSMRANVIRGDDGGPMAEVATIERLETVSD